MKNFESIKNVIYKTIHRNQKPIEQIAEEMGVESNTLYRYALSGPSGTEIPLRRLIPLMKAASNYTILKHIAELCGYCLVKVPRYKASKGDSNDIVSKYQNSTADAIGCLIKFFKSPTFKNYELVNEKLNDVMQESIGAKKYINKEYCGQIEIF